MSAWPPVAANVSLAADMAGHYRDLASETMQKIEAAERGRWWQRKPPRQYVLWLWGLHGRCQALRIEYEALARRSAGVPR